VPRPKIILFLAFLGVSAVLWLGQGRLIDAFLVAIDWLRGQGAMGAALFGVGYFVAGLVALPMFPLGVFGGLVYGFEVGFVVLLPGAVLSAGLAGWLGGTWFRAGVLAFVGRRPTWRAVFTEVSEKGTRAVILNRLAPVLPFGVQNYALGAMGVRPKALVVGTLVGMQPAIWMALYLGVMVGDLSQAKAAITDGGGDLRLYLSVGGLVALTVLVVWLGRVARRARRGAG